MGLLDSILGAMSGKGDASGQAGPLIGVLGGLLAQSGGLQGLANKFSQSGQGDTFSSWVGMGENQSISSNQIQNVLGSEQVKALAAKMGVDPAQASHFLADYLPKIVDKLNARRKSGSHGGPPTGFGQPASGALAKPRRQTFRRRRFRASVAAGEATLTVG